MKSLLNGIYFFGLFIICPFANLAQNYFPSGNVPVPIGTQTCIPIPVSGLNPGNITLPWGGPGVFMFGLTLNIQTSHPWTLEIQLVSPAGDSLLLSSFNGAGGVNYTNTNFEPMVVNSIVGAPAPFTGTYQPQGSPPGFDLFLGGNANGIWQLCILDTLTDTTQVIPGTGMNATSTANATIGFGNACIAPCNNDPFTYISVNAGPVTMYTCPGIDVDLTSAFDDPMNPQFYWACPGGNCYTDQPGIYNLVGTDFCTGACEIYAIVEVLLSPQFNAGTDTTLNICLGSTINLGQFVNYGSSTNTNWYYNGSYIPSSAVLNASQPGTYVLITGTNSECNDTVNISLNNIPAPALGLDQQQDICSNMYIDLTQVFATSGYTTSWTFNGTPIPDPVNVNIAGTYTVIASAGTGCSDTADIVLNIIPGPDLGADLNETICSGTSIDLEALFLTSGLITDWTLNGNPISGSAVTNATVAGSYFVIGTDINGCNDTAEVTLTVVTTPNLGPDLVTDICAGTSTNISSLVNTNGVPSTWYFGGVVIPAPNSVNNGGFYTIIANAGSGCTDTAMIELLVNPGPALGPDTQTNFCTNTTIDLNQSFSLAGMTANWTINGATVSNPSAVAQPGLYSVLATDVFGCTDDAFLLVNQLTAPEIGPNQNSSICQGFSVNLNSFINSSGVTVDWFLAGLPVGNSQSVTIAGNYQAIATAPNGCFDTSFVNLTVNQVPSLGPDQQQTECSGIPVNLNALYNTGNLNVNWSFLGNPVLNPGSVLQGGNYTLIATSAFGCSDTADVALTFNPSPTLGNDLTIEFCSSEFRDLTSLFNLQGLSAVWTLNGSLISEPLSINSAGSYQVIAANSYNCSDTALVSVTVNPTPDLGDDKSLTLCQWMNVNLNEVFDIGANSFEWIFNGSPITQLTDVHDSGYYFLTATNIYNCSDQAQLLINNMECECLADFSVTGHCIQDPVTFLAKADSAILSVNWYFNLPYSQNSSLISPVINIFNTDSVEVILVANLSCGTDTVNKSIKLEDCAELCHFYVPSAFTPNNDGINDRFSCHSECLPEFFDMAIYNRYGQEVFTSSAISKQWDGTYLNSISPEGVYLYKLKYKFPYQDTETETGQLIIVR